MITLQQVELGVLGPLQVRQYGLPVAIPGAKPRAILTMLGLHGGSVVAAGTLLELLWGDDPPRTAAKALQTHISALRRTLGDGFVLTQGTGWTLSTTEIDATRYTAAAKLGRDAFATGDVGQAAARFDEALALWRGIPELPDGPRGASEKTRWIEGHAALVEDRADALLATGRAAEIIGELEAAIADAPLRERRWCQLMLALYRAGRQGEALGAYQRARSLLADELGVDPGPDLRRLEAAIVAQDDMLEMPVSQQLSTVTRAVTFLLTDIEGSTAAWEADADAMAVALARHDEIVEQVVTSGGGRLVKTRGEGDATFSVFDRPSAAAAAAIELQEAIRHEPWALAAPMHIRVALHTGEVELRDGDYFGRAVNRAARLRSLAAGDQILCSGATAELVIDTLRDDVLLVDLGMRQLKNLPRPEHVFELRLETADDSRALTTEAPPMERPDLPAMLAGPGPFVGRAHELERLLAAWQTTLDAGTGAVLIAGEPGVGKTRLAGEWSRQAYEQGAVVLYGRCDEDLGAPYQPFAEALRSLVPCLGSKRLRGMRGVEALLPLIPGLTDALPDLATPARADADTERYALFDAVVALLGLAASSAPVVLILDDLHWAAKPTLLLLRHLLRFGENARVQIVGTYRSTDLDRSHPLAAMLADLHRDGSASRLQLGGLDQDDVTAYVAEAGYDDEELARALASVTGGNPFFLIEALRHVDESGGRWDPSTLPQGVREAVSRRLSRLPAETNKALAAAAVVGSRFALDLVERVTEQDLVDPFDEACKAGILIEEPGGRYRFNHALVRQSLLAELASVRRMRLHQRIAATLETEPGADDELLAELAYHYFECAWAGNAAKAVDYCRRAADQAMARLAYEGAADHYDRALHALDELDDELPDRDDLQAELLVARCEALLAAGDVVSATGAVAQLQAAAGDSARLAAWGTCFDSELTMLTHPERLDEIESAVAAAAETLAGLEDAAGEAKAHTVRATCLGRLGRVGDCETALDQALTAARRAGEHRRVNAVLANAPLAALWGPNPVPRAGGRCLDVVRLLRITTGSPVVEATSTRCQGVLDAFRGRAAAGRQLIESARRSLTELGMRHALLEVEQFAGIVELVADDPATAEPHLRRAYNGFRRMGLDADTAETAALLARACLALDRDAEADELCRESERLAGHALKASITWRTVRAQLLARQGDYDEATRVAEEAVALAGRTDALVDHGDACLALATVLRIAGDTAGARAAAEKAVGLYELKGAAALSEKARRIFGARDLPSVSIPPEEPSVELENACVRALVQLHSAVDREAWDELEHVLASGISMRSHRKVVGFSRVTLGPEEWTREAKRLRELGFVRHRHVVVAVRGARLALTRTQVNTADASAGAPQDDLLQLIGLDNDGRIAMDVYFDVDDVDAAIVELDAQYAQLDTPIIELDNACVRAIRRLSAAIDREDWAEYEQMFATDVVIKSHRKIVGFDIAPSAQEWTQQVRHLREIGAQWHRFATVAVRGERLALIRLELGTEDESPGAPREEVLELQRLDEAGRIDLVVFFDVDDMDVAIAELDALHAQLEDEPRQAPPLSNASSRTFSRLTEYFSSGDWAAMSKVVAQNMIDDDRRRTVNAGVRHGRDIQIANGQAVAGTGADKMTSTVIAIRGSRLALCRTSIFANDPQPGAFRIEFLSVVEIDVDEQLVAHVAFDLDDFDAAIAELDARYIVGEAAAHAQTWSAVARSYAALNRHELPATTPDWINIDHRRGRSFATGDMIPYIRAMWNVTPDLNYYAVAVHILSDIGAVVSHAGYGTSQQGFDAEWREIVILTFESDLVNRCETFDDADLDAALARFDELSHPAPRLQNAASRVSARFQAHFRAGNWDAMAEILADDYFSEDRRPVVGAGVQHGGEAQIADMRAIANVRGNDLNSTVIATRGERLVLWRVGFSAHDQGAEPFLTEVLGVVEINGDERLVAHVAFDVDDIDAAFAELDARYLAGEAAPHARTWSVIKAGYAALNRREIPATSPNWVNIDRRRGTAFAPGDQIAFVRASWEDTPDIHIRIEAVHRLTDTGAIVASIASGNSHKGFQAEWRDIAVLTVDDDVFNRCELFGENDLDAALARFDELSRPAPQLENAASRVAERLIESFAARDWAAMGDLLADDFHGDDHRPLVNVDLHGRDAVVESFRAGAELGIPDATSIVHAIRGERLVLTRVRYSVSDSEPDAFNVDLLQIVEIDVDERIAGIITFDIGDIDAALAELDARYLAGEAADHAQTWSAVTRTYAAANRHQLNWTPDCVTVDHRQSRAFPPGEMAAYMHATWDLAPNVNVYIEAVHRLNDLGAIVTHLARGTSQEGFDAEWREVLLLTFEGELVSRCEMFDESDVDAAITRFDELSRPAPRLENAASRAYERFNEHLADRDWDAMAAMLADDVCDDDHRRVVSSGIRRGRDEQIANLRAVVDVGVTTFESVVVATRGDRLALSRSRVSGGQRAEAFGLEMLTVIEIDTTNRIAAGVNFDTDDIDAAFAELDSRYAAGEAAAYANTWSLIAQNYAAFNRHEFPSAAPDWVTIDHRQVAPFEPGGLSAYIRSTWDVAPDTSVHIETVHRLSDRGAIITQVSKGTSQQGFEVEWREICLLTVDGELYSGCELFDEADLDAALARFDELSGPPMQLANAATRIRLRVADAFNRRDIDEILAMADSDGRYEDRRKGLSDEAKGTARANVAHAMFEAVPASWRSEIEPLAIRGSRLSLTRDRYRDTNGPDLPVVVELLTLMEVADNELVRDTVLFDPDDIDGAFEELESRFVAGEAAIHAHTWSVVARNIVAFNRCEPPTTTPDWVNIDHRRGPAFEPGHMASYIHATWDVAAAMNVYIEAVHRLSDLGTVFTQVVHGTSHDGFDAEWRDVVLITLDGDLINRIEVFDEADLDAAIARFDELSSRTARLENPASQAYKRFLAHFAAHDWDALAEILAVDVSDDDRRHVVNAGFQHGRDALIANMRATAEVGVDRMTSTVLATRGERLALTRVRSSVRRGEFTADVLSIVEIDADNRIAAGVLFDTDDLDAAFEELDRRYAAGEAAQNVRTWSAITQAYAALNRHELPTTPSDFVHVDHHRLALWTGDFAANMRAAWEVVPDWHIRIVAVHRLTGIGVVVTCAARGTSRQGFDAEQPGIAILTVQGELINRFEYFDETDLDSAFARFRELSRD